MLIFHTHGAGCVAPSLSVLLITPFYDQAIAFLLAAGPCALCGFAPGSNGVPADGVTSFTTTVGVINRVHYLTANGGSDSQMAGAPGFTNGNVFVFKVSYLTNGGQAFLQHHTHFALGQAQGGMFAFLGH